MMVQFEVLREAEPLKEQLCEAGWEIVEEQTDRLTARHDRIADEVDARQCLQELGLLTSPLLRIRFVKSRRLSSRRQLVKA